MSDPRPTKYSYDLEALEFQAVRSLLMLRLVTPLGRTAVEDLAPLESLEVARRELAIVGGLAAKEVGGDMMPLAGAVEVRSWLQPCFEGEHLLQARDLADLKRTLRAGMRCRRWLLASGDTVLVGCAMELPELEDLVAELELLVDDRGEVLDSASARLRALRQEIEAARTAVDAAVQRVLNEGEVRKYLQAPEPAWRHGRPVLQVRQEFRNRVPGVLHDRSASGATVFVEPDRVVEAANRLADAVAAEHREVQVVLADAARALRRLREPVQAAVVALARFDLRQAKARLIAVDGFHLPELIASGCLRLVAARHPILLGQREPEVIVPLDLGLGDPSRVIVVTGPSTGGKTVVLKTVGLLALMALAAVPLPASEGCQVPFFFAVKADIGDEQGISQNLSTFSSHVRRIASCLAHAGPGSLLLLDELGAGTDPEEGGVLGYAVLEEILHRGSFAVVTTHLGRLKDFAYQNAGAENGSMAFDGISLQPLFRLDVGIPGSSHALDIAGRVGMPAAVVERAKELLGVRDTSLQQLIQRVQDARRDAEADRRRSAELSRRVEQQRADLEGRLFESQRKANWLEEEADAAVEEQLRATQAAAMQPLAELVNAPGLHGQRARELKSLIDGMVRKAAVHRRRMRFCGQLRKGDQVYLPRWSRLGVVHKVDSVKELVVVDYGRVRLEVPFEDVSWLQPLGDPQGQVSRQGQVR